MHDHLTWTSSRTFSRNQQRAYTPVRNRSRVQLPNPCRRGANQRIWGLSPPYRLLRANADDLSTNNAVAPKWHEQASVQLASIRPEVLQILPEHVDLDMLVFGEQARHGVLDIAKLCNVNNDWSSLWLSIESDQSLADPLLRRQEPHMTQNPANPACCCLLWEP